MNLHLDFCSHEAARFACRAWHYSRSLPASRRVLVGAWENERFIGCFVFSRGNTPNIGRPFGLSQREICELTRVALGPHVTPTSRILAIALRMLRQQSPGLKLIVSFSDPHHGHDGRGVYAAGNWIYLGVTNPESLLRVHGHLRHPRTVGSKYGHRGLAWLRQYVDPHAERVVTVPKHKYLYPLDDDMRAQLAPLTKPYPKRERSAESGTPATGRRGDCNVTRSLSHSGEATAHV